MSKTQRVTTLSDDQVSALADHYVHQVLLNDDRLRMAGFEDHEFQAFEAQLNEQRSELGRLLAQEKGERLHPALHSFLYMCGVNLDLPPEDVKKVCYRFLQSVVTALDHQRSRNQGLVVPSSVVARAESLTQTLGVVTKSNIKVTWEEVFIVWRDYVPDRPKSTAIASQTAWRDLQRFASVHQILAPDTVTPVLLTNFVDDMAGRGLAIDTLNERLSKIKAIYKIAFARHKLLENPAVTTIGKRKSGVEKRKVTRLSFDESDVVKIFSSPIYSRQLRSKGQAKEASYWIPLLMYYTGARTEEVAGLALNDFKQHPVHGWYIDIVDRPEDEDKDLFPSEANRAHSRTLKNGAFVRRVPVAKELTELGLCAGLISIDNSIGDLTPENLDYDQTNRNIKRRATAQL